MELENLQLDPLYANHLNIKSFARMLESPTQSYKFYWLEAILTLLPEKDEMTFKEIITEMIWEAWYTVTQYHLRLGPTVDGNAENYIEHAIHLLEDDSELKLPITKDQFYYLMDKNYSQVKPDFDGLIKNVPYRLLSSFMDEIGGNDRIWDQKARLIAYIEHLSQSACLPYTIIPGAGTNKRVHINEYWKSFLLDNYTILKSWIQMKKVRFLQDRNPGVPGIIYKLDDESVGQRQLEQVKNLWIAYSKVEQKPVIDIYTENEIQFSKLSIDHFVPRSYISNDELWNLTPMDRSLNSSKSNRLPEWTMYFDRFANNQYELYQSIHSHDAVKDKFTACLTKNVNSIWAVNELYIKGNSKERFRSILEKHLQAVYEDAYLQGYAKWQVQV